MQRRTLMRALIGGALGVLGLPAREVHGQERIISTIYDAAGRHGVSGEWLLNTAVCESQLDPWAYNEMTGDVGLFQFKPSTWAEWGADPSAIWDAWSQADMAGLGLLGRAAYPLMLLGYLAGRAVQLGVTHA